MFLFIQVFCFPIDVNYGRVNILCNLGLDYNIANVLLVSVRRVPPQFSIPPPTMEKVKVGENISIPCVAVGSPMPYVKWRRGKTTELSPEDKLPVGRNVLNLTNVEVSDNYTCIAASSLGMIEATTFIKVLSKLTFNVN